MSSLILLNMQHGNERAPGKPVESNAPTAPTPRSFTKVTSCSLEMKKLNRELSYWEKIYNTVRPHQAHGYLTPQTVPAPNPIPTKGMKSVTHLLDEYSH
jgi:hypothetical protein